MATGFRVVTETYDLQSGVTLNRKEIDSFNLKAPKHIQEVGLNQLQQINILQNVLNSLLPEQFLLLDDQDSCPKCNQHTKKAGRYKSHFHSVYTDHIVEMGRRMCSCGWKQKYTVEGYFGFSSHPDLLKMQCALGAEQSYMKAQATLEKKSGKKRTVNNRTNIARTVCLFGSAISDLKTNVSKAPPQKPSQTLIAQIDGGHISTNIKDKRSYEVLAAKVYNPENLVKVTDDKNKLTSSTCVASAKSDKQSTIKKQVLYAALQEGMTSDTKVYLLADGAKNCWSAASLLYKSCHTVISILDWCHIGRAFKHAEQELSADYHERLDKAKWSLWHGDAEKCQIKLQNIYSEAKGEFKLSKLTKLQTYIKNNISKIINYAEHKEKQLPFTSSVMESAIENVINARHSQTRKMQWTREGAHPVVQIRASKASLSWDTDWGNAFEHLLAA